MKPILLIFLALATVPALSQSFTPNLESTAACEVNVVHASFDRPGGMMRISSQEADAVARDHASKAPSITVQLHSSSGKPVQSISVTARIKVKNSIYQLDSFTRDFPLTFISTESEQRLQLAQSALGLVSLTIDQVTYNDGTTWRPEHRAACGYNANRGAIRTAQ